MIKRSMYILLVDDNEDDFAIVRGLLSGGTSSQFILERVSSVEQARTVLEHVPYDVCLVEYRLGQQGVFEVLSATRSGKIPFIVLSEDDNHEVEHVAAQTGAADCLVKSSLNALLLDRAIRYAIRHNEFALAEAQWFAQTTLDTLSSAIAVLDEQGIIIATNKSWRECTAANDLAGAALDVGTPYLAKCEAVGAPEGPTAATGIRAVAERQREEFHFEYAGCEPENPTWFLMRVTRFPGDGPVRIVVEHENITERKMVEERLRKSEATFAMAQRVAHVGGWEVDVLDPEHFMEANIARWSDEVFRILGHAPGEIEASVENFMRCVHPADVELIGTAAATALVDGKSYGIDHRLLLPDGTERFVHQQVEIIRDPATGKPVRMVGTMQDITERKRAEDALREREEFQRTLLDNFPAGLVTVFDRDLRFIAAKGRGFENATVGPPRLVGRTLAEVATPEVTAVSEPYLWRALEGETVEYELYSHGRYYQVTVGPLHDPGGSISRVLSVALDITQRKRAEVALRESEERFRAFMDHLPAKAFIKDSQGRYIYMNQAGERINEVSLPDMLGKTCFDLFPAEYAAEVHQQDELVRSTGQPRQFEMALPLPNGERRYDLTIKFPLASPSSESMVGGISIDLSQQKQAEEQRDRFFDLSPDLMCIAGFDGYFKKVNSAFCNTLGYTEAELISRPYIEFVYPEDREALIQLQQDRTQDPINWYENRYCRKDGSVRWLEWNAIRGTADDVVYGVGRDITERKQTEEVLHRAYDELELRVETRTRELREANTRLQVEILEREQAGLQARKRAGQQEAVANLGQRALSDISLDTLFTEAAALVSTSLTIAVCCIWELLPESETLRLRAFAGLPLDSTIPRTLRAGIQSQAGYTLLENSPVIVGDFQDETRFRPAPAFLEKGMRSSASVVIQNSGHPFGTLLVASAQPNAFNEDDLPFLQLMANVLAAAIERAAGEAEIRQLNEELRTANSHLKAEIAERQMAMGALRQSAEALAWANRQAEQARQEAETANRAKSEFLSRMSHELRTPLNSILGYGQILEMLDDPDTRDDVKHILKAGRHLLNLINEVLDIARIEAGRLSLSPEPLPVNIAVSETLDLVRPLAAAHGIELLNEISELDAARHVLADRQRLKQVLVNLLSNGIKYNRAGGQVAIACNVHDWELDLQDHIQYPGHLRFLVRDTGLGIAPEDLTKIFVPFERLGAAQSQIEGTGIGLSLCKRLMDAMNGQIGVESVVNQGSTFWVELPLAPNPAETVHDETAPPEFVIMPPEKRATILCIEDNPINLQVIERALRLKGGHIELLSAGQGSIGLDLARQHQPHLILLDVHLPDMLGDEVLRHLQTEPSTQNIPVVILSADASPGRMAHLASAGARGYLTKPLDLKLFYDILEQVLASRDV